MATTSKEGSRRANYPMGSGKWMIIVLAGTHLDRSCWSTYCHTCFDRLVWTDFF